MNPTDTLGRDLTGLQTLQALIAAGGGVPIGETLDFTLIEAEEGASYS